MNKPLWLITALVYTFFGAWDARGVADHFMAMLGLIFVALWTDANYWAYIQRNQEKRLAELIARMSRS